MNGRPSDRSTRAGSRSSIERRTTWLISSWSVSMIEFVLSQAACACAGVERFGIERRASVWAGSRVAWTVQVIEPSFARLRAGWSSARRPSRSARSAAGVERPAPDRIRRGSGPSRRRDRRSRTTSAAVRRSLDRQELATIRAGVAADLEDVGEIHVELELDVAVERRPGRGSGCRAARDTPRRSSARARSRSSGGGSCRRVPILSPGSLRNSGLVAWTTPRQLPPGSEWRMTGRSPAIRRTLHERTRVSPSYRPMPRLSGWMSPKASDTRNRSRCLRTWADPRSVALTIGRGRAGKVRTGAPIAGSASRATLRV